jgi:hypothetical protein
VGPSIIPKIENNRARITEITLKLNRPVLLEQRNRAIQEVDTLFQTWHTETSFERKKVLEAELHDTYHPDKEYRGSIKAHLNNLGFVVKQ